MTELPFSSPSIDFVLLNKILIVASKSIVKVNCEFGNISGTGCLVYVQNDNYEEGMYTLITAGHVLQSKDLENNSILLSFSGSINLGKVTVSKQYIKNIINFRKLDVILIILKSYVAAHWMRLGAGFLEISRPYLGMMIGIPEISCSFESGLREIKKGDINQIKLPFNLSHNCQTSNGSSGSPIINIDGFVVGIHLGNDNKENEKRGIILEALFKRKFEIPDDTWHLNQLICINVYFSNDEETMQNTQTDESSIHLL